MHGQQNDKYTEMYGQQNDKYTEMHGQQNDKYTEMHGQQITQLLYIIILVPKVCSAKPNGSSKGTHEFHGDIWLRQSLIPDKTCIITRIYCSLNATVAQLQNCHLGLILRLGRKR